MLFLQYQNVGEIIEIRCSRPGIAKKKNVMTSVVIEMRHPSAFQVDMGRKKARETFFLL